MISNPGFGNPDNGFTLIELLVSMAIFSFSLVAIINMFAASLYAGKVANDVTQATNLAQYKIEEIKKLSTEEEDQGITLLGFDYLISIGSGGYLSTMHDDKTHGDKESGDGVYTNQDFIDLKTQSVAQNSQGPSSMVRTWSIRACGSGNFAHPNTVNLVSLVVTVSWQDKVKTRSTTLETLIHRRRFVQ
jgi:prepilin-type N-terminal cleavage/methylation domain-containing protein